MSAHANYETSLAIVAPMITPALGDLLWAALGAADDPIAWQDRLKTAGNAFIESVRSAPDIFFRSNEIGAMEAEIDALRARVVVAEEDADRLAPFAQQIYDDLTRLTTGMTDAIALEYLGKARSAVEGHSAAVVSRTGSPQ